MSDRGHGSKLEPCHYIAHSRSHLIPAAVETLAIRGSESRFRHVIKHLYRQEERWDMVVEGLPSDLRELAGQSGCNPGALRTLQAGYFDVCATCQAHVLKDHDKYYAPAYLRDVESGRQRGWCGRSSVDPNDVFVVGHNGILTLIKPGPKLKSGRDRAPMSVATAHRVRPGGGRDLILTPEDFLDAALDKLSDKSDFEPGGSK